MRTKGQARRAGPRGRGLPQAPLRRVAASPARPPSPQTSPASRGAPALRDPPTHRDPEKLILRRSAQAGTYSRGAAGPGSASALGVQRPGPGRPSRGRTVLVSRGPSRGSSSLPPSPPFPPPSSSARPASRFQSLPPQPRRTLARGGRGGAWGRGGLGEREAPARAHWEGPASSARTRPGAPAPPRTRTEPRARRKCPKGPWSSAPLCREGGPAAGTGAPGCRRKGGHPSAHAAATRVTEGRLGQGCVK